MISGFYLYGAGGHAKVIIDILQENNIHVEAIIDDNINLSQLNEIPIIHVFEEKGNILISIGNNATRKKIAQKYESTSYFKAIAKTAIISPFAEIGAGSVVMQGVVIQSGAVAGRHSIINTRANIDHDCVIGDFVHIAPGSTLCGNVSVGEGSLIGAGTVILPGVKIGKWSVIGAGSVVTKDIPDHVLAVGNICKVKRYNYEQ